MIFQESELGKEATGRRSELLLKQEPSLLSGWNRLLTQSTRYVWFRNTELDHYYCRYYYNIILVVVSSAESWKADLNKSLANSERLTPLSIHMWPQYFICANVVFTMMSINLQGLNGNILTSLSKRNITTLSGFSMLCNILAKTRCILGNSMRGRLVWQILRTYSMWHYILATVLMVKQTVSNTIHNLSSQESYLWWIQIISRCLNRICLRGDKRADKCRAEQQESHLQSCTSTILDQITSKILFWHCCQRFVSFIFFL